MYRFDYLVFIGRFQPFHIAHLKTVNIALEQSHYVVLALGSAQPERSLKNPFLVTERKQMILANFNAEQQKRILFAPIIDLHNDQKWVEEVKKQVLNVTEPNTRVGLIGHFKDDSSYYLALFPEWPLVELDGFDDELSATPLREAFFQGELKHDAFANGTLDFLQQFQKTAIYQQLQDKYRNEQYDSPR